MLILARVIAQGARNRDECRGAHYKPDFDDKNPKATNPIGRDDKSWLRSTLAKWGGRDGALSKVEFIKEFDYSLAGQRVHCTDAVDVSLMELRKRDYTKKKAAFAKDDTANQPKGAAETTEKGQSAQPSPPDRSLEPQMGKA